ncbi:MAG: hypothetical protein AVDCRST_MAG20-318, partial [uncultured Acidimicrobiales bacterium]
WSVRAPGCAPGGGPGSPFSRPGFAYAAPACARTRRSITVA